MTTAFYVQPAPAFLAAAGKTRPDSRGRFRPSRQWAETHHLALMEHLADAGMAPTHSDHSPRETGSPDRAHWLVTGAAGGNARYFTQLPETTPDRPTSPS